MSLKGPGGVVGMGLLPRADEGYAPCTHYASPTGTSSASGLTPSAPLRPQDFWALAGPGKTLCLMDGDYQGAPYMLSPGFQTGSAPPSGTSGQPVTVRALHDGAVLIDGQYTRVPVRMNGAIWYELEGFDACCGGGSPGFVLGGGGQHDVTYRRIVGWDADDDPVNDTTNSSVWEFGGGVTQTSDNVLFEDAAAFGIGRKQFHCLGCINWVTHRVWSRHGGYGSTQSNPRTAHQGRYNTIHARHENAFATWSEEDVLNPFGGEGALIPGPAPDDPTHTFEFYGSMGYYLCGVPDVSTAPPVFYNHSGAPVQGVITYKDIVSAIEPGCWTDRDAISLFDPRGISSGTATATIDRATAFGGNGTGPINSRWSPTNVFVGATRNDVPNAFTGAGGRLCHRYIDGVLTAEPLWPWPMDERIKAALARANRIPLKGTAQTVTSEIEYLLGTIPAECRKP